VVVAAVVVVGVLVVVAVVVLAGVDAVGAGCAAGAVVVCGVVVVVVAVEEVLDPLGCAGVVVVVVGGGAGAFCVVVVVACVVVDFVVVVVVVVDEVVFASWPLSLSAVSICFWTAATVAAIAAGDPFAPSDESASSCFSAVWIRCTSSSVGCDLSVTTIWSAIAVVRQYGQLTLSAPAALIGAITLLRPTTSTTWKETATVVHALQLAKAKALFVFVTGSPSLTVTSA
jgi:hypothetical protein